MPGIFMTRRVEGIEVLPEEHDAIIARCKERLRMEGVELFDDWLIRARRLPHVELILEGPVRCGQLKLSCMRIQRRIQLPLLMQVAKLWNWIVERKLQLFGPGHDGHKITSIFAPGWRWCLPAVT